MPKRKVDNNMHSLYRNQRLRSIMKIEIVVLEKKKKIIIFSWMHTMIIRLDKIGRSEM